MERIVIVVEYGGGMFDGIHGVITMKVPENVDLEATFGRRVWKAAEYREPQRTRAFVDTLKTMGATELPVEWLIID